MLLGLSVSRPSALVRKRVPGCVLFRSDMPDLTGKIDLTELLARGRGTKSRSQYYREIAHGLRARSGSPQSPAEATEAHALAAAFERLAEYRESSSTPEKPAGPGDPGPPLSRTK